MLLSMMFHMNALLVTRCGTTCFKVGFVLRGHLISSKKKSRTLPSFFFKDEIQPTVNTNALVVKKKHRHGSIFFSLKIIGVFDSESQCTMPSGCGIFLSFHNKELDFPIFFFFFDVFLCLFVVLLFIPNLPSAIFVLKPHSQLADPFSSLTL